MRFSPSTKEFLITDTNFKAGPGWSFVELREGWRIYFQTDVRHEQRFALSGGSYHLIGDAYCFDEDARSGSGRYVLLDWPYVATDAVALLGLYYGQKNGRRAISSSPALAAEVINGAPAGPDVTVPLRHRSAINYIPMPGCGYAGLRKLFHDQKLDLRSFTVASNPSRIAPLDSYGQAVSVLAEQLCCFALELRKRIPGTIYLPLTAGVDSRSIAAALLATDTDFETVTLDYVGKPRSDVTVARSISARVSVPHHTIDLRGQDLGAAEMLWHQTSGAFLDWDNTHVFPGNGYRYAGPGDAIIFGSCFDIGRQTSAAGCFAGLTFDTATGAEVWQRRTSEPGPKIFTDLLDEWIAWRRSHPLRMDFGAAFYLDQRLTGWRAGLELGYHLLPAVSLNPANDTRILSAMITPEQEDRVAGRLQRDVIRMLAPELSLFPVNPVTRRDCVRKFRHAAMRKTATALTSLIGMFT